MYTALLISGNYAQTTRIKRKIDWEALSISLFTEYGEIGSEEKIASIQPDILILGQLFFNNVNDLLQIARSKSPNVQVFLISPEPAMANKALPALHILREDAFTTEALQKLLTVVQPPKANVRSRMKQAAELPELLKDVSEHTQLYFLRILPYQELPFPTDEILQQQLPSIFEDFWLGYIHEPEGSLCLVLQEPERVSILFSIKILGDMIQSLKGLLHISGIKIHPVLVSEKTTRSHAKAAYGNLKQMEAAAYFCPEFVAITAAQFRLMRKPIRTDAVSRLMDSVLMGTLNGNIADVDDAIHQIYMELLKPSMDLAALGGVRTQLTDLFQLVSAIGGYELRGDAFSPAHCKNVETECQYVCQRFSDICHVNSSGQPFHEKVLQALKFLFAHYGEELSMEGIAEQVGMSSAYFSRQFKDSVGMGFIDCLNQIRIWQAKRLFHEGSCAIEHVSRQVGYTDPKYFSRVFKRLTGCSPSAYVWKLQQER